MDHRVEVGPRILSISSPGGVKLLLGWYGTQEPVRLQRDRFKRFVEEALPQRADDPRSSGGRTGRAGRDVASASSWHGWRASSWHGLARVLEAAVRDSHGRTMVLCRVCLFISASVVATPTPTGALCWRRSSSAASDCVNGVLVHSPHKVSSRGFKRLLQMIISCVATLPLALVLNSAGPLNAAARPAGHARSHAIKLAVDASTFATPQWESLAIELDTLPVFAIVDEAGELGTQQVYVDPQAAEEACELARKSSGDDQLDTTPTGLGTAFRAAREGAGLLVAAMDDVQAAGLDAASAEGKNLPMFVCMELASERTDGTGKEIPIFLSAADAEAAVEQSYDGGRPLVIDTVSLEWAVDQYCNVPDSPTFRFMARSASVQLLRSLMMGGA